MTGIPARRGTPPALQATAKLIRWLPPGVVVGGLIGIGLCGLAGYNWLTWPAVGPQLGPGQYQPLPGPGQVATQPATPAPATPPTSSSAQTQGSAPAHPRIGRVITPDMMPPAQPVVPDRAFATMSDAPDPYPYRARRLNLD